MSDAKPSPILRTLKNLKTIRLQAHRLLALAKENHLEHFSVNSEQMDDTALFVIEVIKNNYPDLNIPYHSRWRHFEACGSHYVKQIEQWSDFCSVEEYIKILCELVIISVFLDAGAGSSWSYTDPQSQQQFSRSEGLALASLVLYQQGFFSNDPQNPLRVDAKKLSILTQADLIKGFQVRENNPLEGLAGRVALLNRLGHLILENKRCFGSLARLGDFYLYLKSLILNPTMRGAPLRPAACPRDPKIMAQSQILGSRGQAAGRSIEEESHTPISLRQAAGPRPKIEAKAIFTAVLEAFQDMWPPRLMLEGESLGDVGLHSGLKSAIPGSEYIPFHKLSQWLTYSLLEPLEKAQFEILGIEALTGLPEYRNGGLLIDTGLLVVKNKNLLDEPQDPNSEAVVEWRGLTVALLDELALHIRTKLQTPNLALSQILQGGTWEAGRRIAKIKRSKGTPPIQIISDGTLF